MPTAQGAHVWAPFYSLYNLRISLGVYPVCFAVLSESKIQN